MYPLTHEKGEVHSALDTSFTPSIDSVLVSAAAGNVSGFAEASDELTLRGRSEPGTRVIVQSAEQRLGTALVNGQGEWSFAMPTQNPAAHCVSVIAVSAFGLEGVVSSPFYVSFDGLTASVSQVAVTHAAAVPEVALEVVAPVAATPQASDAQGASQLSRPYSVVADTQLLVESESAVVDGIADLTAEVAVAPLALGEAPAESDVQPADPIGADIKQASASLNSVLDDSVADGKSINSGDATFDRTPTLRGSGEAGSQVVIYSNDEQIGNAWVDDAGGWSFTPDQLALGEHQISVVAIDLAGNISAPSPPFLVVIAAPVLETVTELAPISTWDQLADGNLPLLLPATQPELSLAVYPIEPVLDFSLIAQPLSDVGLDAAPSLTIDNLLTQDTRELFVHADSGLEQLQEATDDLLVIDVEAPWNGLDEVNSTGMEHTSAPAAQWQLESDDPSFTPLI